MAKKRPEELSKSEFGAYEPLYPETGFDKFMYKHFVKRNPNKAAINLAAITGLVVFYFFGSEFEPWNTYPLYIWFGWLLISTIIGLIYWRRRIKKLDKEIFKVEGELTEIKKELNERQKAFNEIKKEMLDQN